MRKSKLMKSMSKSVFALCIALSIFVCNSAVASAAVMKEYVSCSVYGKEGHQFSAGPTGEEFDTHETHMHYYGKNLTTGEDIYVSCTVTYHFEYWAASCKCGEVQEGSRELKNFPPRHSVK